MHKIFPKIFVFLNKYESNVFKNNITNLGIIYRNYKAKNKERELFKIAKACKASGYKLFVSNNINLAIKARADGLYIPSFNKSKHFLNREKKNFIIIGSAHNQKEIKEKISQNCSKIFLSPLFYVKKSKKFLGIHQFNFLSNNNKMKFLALGGISKSNIYKLKLLNINGFGGISLFKKKTGLLKAGFLKI